MNFNKTCVFKTELPQVHANTTQWKENLYEELNKARKRVSELAPPPLFQALSDDVDGVLDGLRVPTVQETIHSEVLRLQQSFIQGSRDTCETPSQKNVTLLDEHGIPFKFPPNKDRQFALVYATKPVDWTEEALYLYNRLTVPLETYKLSNDFRSRRFKRNFTSYNLTPQPHATVTQQLEQGQQQERLLNAHQKTTLQTQPGRRCDEEGVGSATSRAPRYNNRMFNDFLFDTSEPLNKSFIPALMTPVPLTHEGLSLLSGVDVPKADKHLIPCPVAHKKRSSNENTSDSRSLSCSKKETSGTLVPPFRKSAVLYHGVPLNTAMITVSFYHPIRGFKLEEFDIPDYQTLAHLRDMFTCDEDLCTYAQKYKASFFFIDGIFYYDGRDSCSATMTQRLFDYLKRNQYKRLKDNASCVPMETAVLSQMILPFHSRCGYMHRGDCEHRVMFTSFREYSPALDSPYQGAYPLSIYRPSTRRTLCQACLINVAKKTVTNSSRLPQSAVQLCIDCFNHFFFTEDGNCVTDEDFIYFDFHDIY